MFTVSMNHILYRFFFSFIPGEKCEIKVEVRVDKKSAYKLNSGVDQLYDILVLHLEGGKDIFITVTGKDECPTSKDSL